MTCQTYCFPFLEPGPTEGPIKLPLSVCQSINLAFFFVFMIFGTMVDNQNILKTDNLFFPEKIIFAQIMGQNAVR